MNAFSAFDLASASMPLRVGDVMQSDLVSCAGDASLDDVARLMSTQRVHCVVVVEGPSDAPSLWGVVSDLDLIAAATVRPLAEQNAGGSAMRPAIALGPGETLDAAARLMTRFGIAHLVVVDPVEQCPIGVLSTLDLARALSAA